MGKSTTADSDRGLIDAVTLTADGSTTGIKIPTGQVLNIGMKVPSGVTGVLEVSVDGGVSFYTMTPRSLSTIDATAAAKNEMTTYYTEEPGLQIRASGAGTWGGGTLYLRIAGAAQGY